MKRILTLLFITLISQSIFAQKLDYDHDSKWFLGLNTGVAWNTTDVKNKANIGWGLTLGRAFNYNYGKKISFDLRFRYLGAKWRGQDYDTTSMVGYNSSINPVGNVHAQYDTLGYTINNFQTQVHEFGLELVLHANSLRENSGWDPYIFGGANLVWNQTKGDLLFEDSILSTSDIYNYSVDGMSKKEWRDMRDKEYESLLDGSLNRFNVDFMPSLGFGLGYQVGPRFQVGLEHKTTFTMNDLFDGYIDPSERWGMFENDIYHYTNFYLKFHFRHYTEEEKAEREEQNSQTTQTNPNQTTPPPNGGGCDEPKISINSPSTSSINVYNNQYKIKALIEDVAGRNNIVFNVNGQVSTNFIYNPNNEQFEANVFLQPGNNSINIEAGNACGKEERRITINYIQCTAPIVEFVSPQGNGVTVINSNYIVNANVVNATTVEYYVNGNRVNSFSHNNATGNFSSNTVLKRGVNVLRIVAKNECGTVEQSTSIDFTNCVSPLVAISNGSNSQIVDNNQFTFRATISDVFNQNDINLRLNGMNKTFSFNSSTGQFVVALTLIRGTNTIELYGSNSCGTDRQTVTIEYVPCSLPSVNIITPSNCLANNGQTDVKVQLTGISNRSQIQLRLNGTIISSGTYNASTRLFQARVSLSNGDNAITVTATNDCGTVNQSVNTNFSPCLPPAVTLILPNQSMTTENTTIVKASLTNVTNRNQILVTINGVVYSGGTYNTATRIYQAIVSVQTGANSIQVKATNNCGNDLKTVNIQYKPCYPPVITVVSPSESSTTESAVLVSVSLQNVTSNNQIQATINGQVINKGNYSSTTNKYEALVRLINGMNYIVINASNSCGMVNQSIQIKKIAEPRKILICHQPTNVKEKPVEMYILLSEWAEHQRHGDILGSCPQVEDPLSSLKYTICHTDPQTGAQSTLIIPASEWPTHQEHGDSQEPCPTVTNDKIITICHTPNGSIIKQEMQIPESEWPTHQAHGDYLGKCTQTGTIGGNPTDSVTICHHLPGSSETTQMVIPQNQWLIHQAHGDKLGPCAGGGTKSNENNQENGSTETKKKTAVKP